MLVGVLQFLLLTRAEINYAVSKASKVSVLRHVLTVIRLHISWTVYLFVYLCWFTCLFWCLLGWKPWWSTFDHWLLYFSWRNIISWSPKKQHIVARYNTKPDYHALAHIIAEIRWILSYLHELHISLSCPPTVWCDNIGATYLEVNTVFHHRTNILRPTYISFMIWYLLRHGMFIMSLFSSYCIYFDQRVVVSSF